MVQAWETRKLIDANWHAIYKMWKLIAVKLNSFTVCDRIMSEQVLLKSKDIQTPKITIILIKFDQCGFTSKAWKIQILYFTLG